MCQLWEKTLIMIKIDLVNSTTRVQEGCYERSHKKIVGPWETFQTDQRFGAKGKVRRKDRTKKVEVAEEGVQ